MGQNTNVNDSYNVRVFNRDTSSYENAMSILPNSTKIPELSSASKHKLVVFGDLEVLGATRTVESTITQISDNEIVLNNGELGEGVSRGFAGLSIDRGTASDARFTFYENSLGNYWSPDHSTHIGLAEESLLLLASAPNTPNAPALAFFEDRDTGLYRQSANKMSLVTAGVNAFTISPTQTIGIGVDTSTSAKINIVATESTGIKYSSNNASSTDLHIINTNTNYAGKTINLAHTRGASTVFNFIKSSAAGLDQFYVRGDGAAYFKRNVGIGVEPSNYGLHILDNNASGVDFPLYVENTGLGTTSHFHSTSASFTEDSIASTVDIAGSTEYNHLRLKSSTTDVFVVNGLGDTAIAGKLDVIGDTTLTRVLLDNGSVGVPSYTFKTDTDTGLYLYAPDSLSVTTGGVRRMTIDTDEIRALKPIRTQNGSASIPSYSFDVDSDTGMYYDLSTGSIMFSWDAVDKLEISDTYSQFYQDLIADKFATDVYGTAAAPVVIPRLDSNTGMYFANDQVNFSTAGVQRVEISSSSLTTTVNVRSIAGSVTNPSYTFTTDTNTGMYSPIAGTIGFSVDGVTEMQINAAGITSTNRIYTETGTALLPAYTFTGDTDTGMYNATTDTLSFATAGTPKLTLNDFIRPNVPILGSNGSATAPIYSFGNSSDSGMYMGATGDVRFTVNGNESVVISETLVDIDGVVEADKFTSETAGSAAAPVFVAKTDTTTGMYFDADSVMLATDGVNRLDVSNTNITSTVNIRSVAGSVTEPSFAFATDTNTGIYSPAAGTIGFAVDGITEMSVAAAGVTSTNSFFGARGAATTPTYTFAADTNTGFYSQAENAMSFVTGGSSKLVIDLNNIRPDVPMLSAQDGTAALPVYSFASSPDSGMYVGATGDVRFTVNGNESVVISGTLLDFDGVVEADVFTSETAGSAAAPVFVAKTDTTTGMYFDADSVMFATDGINRLDVSNTNITSTVNIRSIAGSVTNPSYTFTTDANTGMYSPAAGTIGFAVDGITEMQINASGITSTNMFFGETGSATTPTYTFTGDTNTGMFRSSVDTLGLATAGVNKLSIGTVIAPLVQTQTIDGTATTPSYSFASSPDSGMYTDVSGNIRLSVNGNESVIVYGSLIDVDGVVEADKFTSETAGTAAAPVFVAKTDTTTGMYFDADSVILATDGVNRLDVSNTNITSAVNIRSVAGSVTEPSFAFATDTNTGMYSPIAGTIGFAVDGVTEMQINASGITSTNRIYTETGTALLPAYTFTGDTDTGMYNSTTDTLSFATAGTTKLTLNDYIRPNVPILGSNGSATAPIYSFGNSSNSGMYMGATGDVRFTVNGNESVVISETLLDFDGVVEADKFTSETAGSAAAPVFVAKTDTTTGMYFDADSVMLATDGIKRLDISSTLVSSVRMLNVSGTETAPAYSFSGDTDTGIYNTTGALNFAVDGVNQLSLTVGGISSTNNVTGPHFYGVPATNLLPTYSFSGDDNTGMYSPTANAIGFTSGGVTRLTVDSSYIRPSLPILSTSNGTASAPVYSFAASPDSGMYVDASGNVKISVNGIEQLNVTSGSSSFSGVTGFDRVDLKEYGTAVDPAIFCSKDPAANEGIYFANNHVLFSTNTVKRFDIGTIDIVHDVPLRATNSGSITAPQYSFVGDTDTGMYRAGINQLGFTTNGLAALILTTTGANITGVATASRLLVGAGSNAAPGLSFTGDTNTGIHGSGDILSLIAGGVAIARASTSSLTIEEKIYIQDGTVLAPSIAFESATNTGMYFDGGEICFAIGGVKKFSVTNSGSIVTPTGTFATEAWANGEFTTKANNLSDLANKATARTNLGLVSGGVGDIWIKRASDTMTGTLTTRALVPSSNAIYDIGTSAAKYNKVHAVEFSGTATSALYADLAERYESDGVVEPGDVMVIGGINEVTKCFEKYDMAVAGIVSTNPAFKMNAGAGSDETHPYIALKGRVPCKVVGIVKKGDCIVTSDVLGYGMSGGRKEVTAFAIALEDFDGDKGVIEVLVK